MKWILAICVVALYTVEVKAERPRLLARQMADAGGAFHGGHQGRENTYWDSTGRVLGARMRARQAWRQSPGHAANLPMFGLRVVRGANGVGVVGR